MKTHKLFIGISGKMGTGKSTITNLMLSALGNAGKVSMASPIYKAQDLLYEEYDLTLEGDKDRDLLIAIGIWGRDRDPDFWLNQAAKRMIECEYEIIICDDVRFPNEADFFSKYGFLFRIEGEQRGDNVDTSRATDSTECALDGYKFDNVIQNSLSPEEICKSIAKVLMAGK
ncbi:hypothetical protein KAU11_09140 [Candidatus Babeliales bacterium]|nr:hypothetical protein [Candidatus Babeliales bacterium]